jgi:hypothetical protein
MPRPTLKVFKKRKRVFTDVRRSTFVNAISTTADPADVPNLSPRPTCSGCSTNSKDSVSKKKISGNLFDYETYKTDLNTEETYDLITLQQIQCLLDKTAVCVKCKQASLKIFPRKRVGLSLTINVRCNVCDNQSSERNSKIINGKNLK